MTDSEQAQVKELSLLETAGFAGSMFIIGSAFLSLSPLLPGIAQDFGVSIAALGLPAGAYSFAFGGTALAAGSIQDRLPRRVVIVLGTALHFSGLLIAAESIGLEMLVAGFACCGMGAGVLQPAVYALVSDFSAPGARGKLLGRVNFGWAAATLVGVPIAAGAAAFSGWRTTLTIWALLWIAVVLAIRGKLIGPHAANATPANRSSTSNHPVGSTAITLHDLSRYFVLFVATLFIFIGFYGEYTFLGTAVAHIEYRWLPVMSILVSMYGAGFLLGAMNASKIDDFGPLKTLCFVTPALAAVLLLLPFLANALLPMAGAMLVWGTLQALTFTSLTTMAGASPVHVRGRVIAYNTACVMGGASIGSTIAGPVFEQFNYQAVGLLCALTTFGAGLMLFFGLRNQQGVRTRMRDLP